MCGRVPSAGEIEFRCSKPPTPTRSRAILEAALVHDVISCPSNFLKIFLQMSTDEHGKQSSQQAQKVGLFRTALPKDSGKVAVSRVDLSWCLGSSATWKHAPTKFCHALQQMPVHCLGTECATRSSHLLIRNAGKNQLYLFFVIASNMSQKLLCSSATLSRFFCTYSSCPKSVPPIFMSCCIVGMSDPLFTTATGPI